MATQTTTRKRSTSLALIPLLAAACANTLHRETVVDASIEDTWRVLADEYAAVDAWASAIPTAYATDAGPSLPGAPCQGRVCESSLGTATETITRFDREGHVLAYEAEVDTFPFFVRSLSNQWSLVSEGPARTRVVMDFNADLMPGFNVVMWPFMKGKITRLLDESTEELEFYLENGTPHPRKLEAQLAGAE